MEFRLCNDTTEKQILEIDIKSFGLKIKDEPNENRGNAQKYETKVQTSCLCQTMYYSWKMNQHDLAITQV